MKSKLRLFSLATALLLIGGTIFAQSALHAQDANADRIFMIVGEPNTAAWKFLTENPSDREAGMSVAIEKLGGEMLSYYWGLGNGRNYITIRMPDDPGLIQALYVSRLGDGLLTSYQMIELISSPDMAAAPEGVGFFLEAFDEFRHQVRGQQLAFEAGDDAGFDDLALDGSVIGASTAIVVIEAAIAVLATDGVAAFAGTTAEQPGQQEFFAMGVVEFVEAGFGLELGENGRLAVFHLFP